MTKIIDSENLDASYEPQKHHNYKLEIAHTKYGFSLYVIENDVHVSRALREHGYWEPEVTRWIGENIVEGEHCADIGSNLGYFTELIARKSGPAGLVYAFEANPAIAAVYEQSMVDLNFNREMSARIRLFVCGLSDTAQSAFLSVPDENPGGAGITPNSTSTEPTRKCVAVQTNTLENLLSEEDRNQITFAKVDIEGHEPRVWDSLMRCPGLKRMIVELGRYHGSQFLNKISQEFHLFDIRSGEMKELLVEDILAIPHFLNVLCIRKATA